MMNEIRVIAYNDLTVLMPNCLFFFSRKQQRSNQSNQKHVHCVCHRKKVVQLKDVHGVAFTVIWIIAAIRQNCRTLLVSIMMLIAGALGLCKGAHKIMHIIFLLCCT